MKIRIFSLLIVTIICNASFSQKASIQVGLNLANISISDDGDVDDTKKLTSFHAGITGDIPLAGFLYFQPGIFFTGKGTKSQSGDASSATYFRATTNPYYIEIPVNLVFKTIVNEGPRLFAGAGPYIAAGVAGKNEVEGKYLGISFSSKNDIEFSNDDPSTLDYEEGAGFGILKRFDYGLNGTIGLEGKSMTLSVNYGLGLAKIQSGSQNGSDNNNKHRVLSLGLGIKL